MKNLINNTIVYDDETNSQVSVSVYSLGKGLYHLEATNKHMVDSPLDSKDFHKTYKSKNVALKNMINFDVKKLKRRY